MRFKYQYITEEERQNLIALYSDMRLVEEQNITEGNFLIFTDEPLSEQVVYTQVPQEEFELLKQAVDELILTNGGAM